jgi:O-antigen/teichoic acid export membrane protein
MSTKSIASSTLWQIGSQATMAVLSAVSAKFVALALSQQLAGHYNSVYGYLQIFAILADFGLYAVSVRELSAAKDTQRVLGALVTIRFGIATIALGSAVLIAWLIPAWQGTPLPLGITVTAFVPFFTLLAGVLRTVFQVQYKMHYVFIAEVAQRILTVSLMTIVILLGIRSSESVDVLQYFLFVGVVGAALLFGLSLVFASRMMVIRPVFDASVLLPLLKKAMPYGVAFLCIALYRQFDLTMIALLRSDFPLQNALYGFALRVAEMTYLIPTFLLNSTLPLLSEKSLRGESVTDLLQRTFFALLAMSGASSLFAFFWARPIMQVLTADRYLATLGNPGSDTALHFLALPMFCNAIILFSFYLLLSKHAWKPLVLTMIVGVLLSLGLNLSLIPTSGFLGAIRASTIVQLFLALALLPQALRVLPFTLPLRGTLRLGAFFGLLALVLALTSTLATTTLQSSALLLFGIALTLVLGLMTGLKRVFLSAH